LVFTYLTTKILTRPPCSWLALHLLVAQGVLAQKQRAAQPAQLPKERPAKPAQASPRQLEPTLYSPRQILMAIRQEMSGVRRRGQPCYAARFCAARGEQRPGRASAKASRDWPRGKPHQPPKPPKLLALSDAQKALLVRLRGNAA